MNSTSEIDLDSFGKDCSQLDVYVRNKLVANLVKEGNRYVLSYLPDATPDDFVSILMPVRKESWVSEGTLHPYFHMNMPEGALAEMIKAKFGKAMCAEQMSLLGLVGSNMIGAVRVVPSGYSLSWRNMPETDLKSLMADHDSGNAFGRMMMASAGQGISGVMPKILTAGRATVRGEEWIYKHDGHVDAFSNSYEGITLNEYLSLKIAARAGLRVSDCVISEDGHTLATRRFDSQSAPGKTPSRFEDFCSLFGLESADKYKGTMERITFVLNKISSSKPQDKETLLRSHILNTVVGNGDAHLKNYGILYSSYKDIRLSPTFDVVTVRAFDHQYRDIPSLSIRNKKEWSLGREFMEFATIDCGLPKTAVKSLIEEVAQAVHDTIPDLVEAANKHEWFREHAKKMLLVWHEGLSMSMGHDMPSDSEILNRYKLSGVDMSQYPSPAC